MSMYYCQFTKNNHSACVSIPMCWIKTDFVPRRVWVLGLLMEEVLGNVSTAQRWGSACQQRGGFSVRVL